MRHEGFQGSFLDFLRCVIVTKRVVEVELLVVEHFGDAVYFEFGGVDEADWVTGGDAVYVAFNLFAVEDGSFADTYLDFAVFRFLGSYCLVLVNLIFKFFYFDLEINIAHLTEFCIHYSFFFPLILLI